MFAAERRSLRRTALSFVAKGYCSEAGVGSGRVVIHVSGRGIDDFEMPNIRIVATALVGLRAARSASPPRAAQAEETVTITKAGFSPDALGVPTNVFGSRDDRLDEPARALADHPRQRARPGRA